MNLALRPKLVDAMVKAFFSPERLTAWVTLHIPDTNPFQILLAPGFPDRALDLLRWADAEGREDEVLQLLVDYPPDGNRDLILVVFLVTDGAIKPTDSERPPIPPQEDWFVTGLPFANREDLRNELRTLNHATAGGNSILVISGAKSSGKSHSMRFALSCAPHTPAFVDLTEWGTARAWVWQLAAAIYPKGEPEISAKTYDETKEDSYVQPLLIWLTGKLQDQQPRWILVDHSDRGNLTQASSDLLTKLVAKVEVGALPNVRLVIADAKPGILPAKLKPNVVGRFDTADLPDRKAVTTWCVTLAAHLQSKSTNTEIKSMVDDVFAGLSQSPSRDELAAVLETRLSDAYRKLRDR